MVSLSNLIVCDYVSLLLVYYLLIYLFIYFFHESATPIVSSCKVSNTQYNIHNQHLHIISVICVYHAVTCSIDHLLYCCVAAITSYRYT